MHLWYNPMNLIMIIMTFVIAAGLLRSVKAKNKFAVGFATVALLVFLFADYLIIKGV